MMWRDVSTLRSHAPNLRGSPDQLHGTPLWRAVVATGWGQSMYGGPAPHVS
jgi:hypothetical protein